jgi:cardiolipin synthase
MQKKESITLLYTGDEFFPRLIEDFRNAQKVICLETYAFAGDSVARAVLQELFAAKKRGVTIFLMVDWLGTRGYSGGEILEKAKKFFEVAFYNVGWFGVRGISRSHRKVAVIDENICYVGGINIMDDWVAGERRLNAPRWDFTLRMEGSIASLVQKSFQDHWRLVTSPYRIGGDFFRTPRIKKNMDGAKVWFITRDNIRNRFSIEREYLRAIKLAKKKVCLASPYFAPGRRMRKALVLAAKRGVEVQILLGKNEFVWLDRVTRHLYTQFLSVGIKLAEYELTWLHGKVGIVDEQWMTIGSSNFDALSFFVNHEANLFIRNHGEVAVLQNYFDQAFSNKNSTKILLSDVSKKNFFSRFFDGVCYFLYRWLMKIITIGKYD